MKSRLSYLFAPGLVLLVGIVYLPVFGGGFIWDDLLLVHQNPLVKGDFDLGSIWFQSDFPLANIVLWMQWLAWGENATGYHIVNISLHAANAVLLWVVLRHMRIRAAWLAAVLFAVHPVCVASVAWISEIKNTLSLAFFLVAFFAWLKADSARKDSRIARCDSGVPDEGAIGLSAASGPAGASNIQTTALDAGNGGYHLTVWYAAALGAFILALLTKTSTVMFPVSLLLWTWWDRGRITTRDVIRTAPFFLLSLGFGLLTVWMQNQQVLRGEIVQEGPFWGRFLMAAKAVWFYACKDLLPLNLNMIYPRWSVGSELLLGLILMALLAGLFVLFAWFRRSWGRHALFGAGFFVVNLFPVLGFFDMYYLAISRVSDHFQYLPIMGLLALVAGGLHTMLPRRLLPATALPLVAGLSFLSFQRAGVLASDEALWRDTLARNPEAWTAHNNLGCILAEKQDVQGALEHFERSVSLNPRNARAHGNLAQALRLQGRLSEAEEHFRTSLQLKWESPDVQKNFGSALTGMGRHREAVKHFQEAVRLKPDADVSLELAGLFLKLGEPDKAIGSLKDALKVNPDFPEALNNLAWLRATASEDSLRDAAEAVRLAERACQLTGQQQTVMLATLSAAYANAGRYEEAVATGEKALAAARAKNERQFAAIIQLLMKQFRAGRPWREAATRSR